MGVSSASSHRKASSGQSFKGGVAQIMQCFVVSHDHAVYDPDPACEEASVRAPRPDYLLN